MDSPMLPRHSGPWSGMDHPTPSSPHLLSKAEAHSLRSGSDISGADWAAIEARETAFTSYDQRVRQHGRDRLPIVPPHAGRSVPLTTASMQRELLPNGALGTMARPQEDRAMRVLEAYKTQYKRRVVNECRALRATPSMRTAHVLSSHRRLGVGSWPEGLTASAPYLPLYESERLIRDLEQGRRWAWPKKRLTASRSELHANRSPSPTVHSTLVYSAFVDQIGRLDVTPTLATPSASRTPTPAERRGEVFSNRQWSRVG